MHDRPRVAVIGIGNMGKNHVRTYSEMPEVKFIGIADLNVELGEKMGMTYQVPFYSDYIKMLNEVNPDAVSVCVPTSLHYQFVRHCLERGIHVLVEKPITMDVRQAEELLTLATNKKALLFVGHIERYNPAVVKVKEMIDKGDLGNVTSILARRVGGFPPQIKDANIAVDLAIHDIDVVNFLLGSLPDNVSVHKAKNHIGQREDSVEFFLQYNGASAYIQANWITPVKIRKLTITGSEGYLEMDYLNQQIEFYKSNYEKFREETPNYSDYILRFSEPDKIVISVAKKEPLRQELIAFISSIVQGTLVNSQYALDALKIALT